MKVKIACHFTKHYTPFYMVSATISSKINGVMYNGIADKIRFQYIEQRVPRSSQKQNLDRIKIKLGMIKPIVLVICAHIGAKAYFDSVLYL